MRVRSVVLAVFVSFVAACASDGKITPLVYVPAGPNGTDPLPSRSKLTAAPARPLLRSHALSVDSPSEAPTPPPGSIAAPKVAGKSAPRKVVDSPLTMAAAASPAIIVSSDIVRFSKAIKPRTAALSADEVPHVSALPDQPPPPKSDAPVPMSLPASPAASHDGSAAYYVPREMVETKAYFVDLWIDGKAPASTLARELAQHLQITADKIRQRAGGQAAGRAVPPTVAEVTALSGIRTGDVMVAQLRGGDDFSVDPKEPLSQSLTGEDRIKWLWRVTPKRSSVEGLELVLEVWINPGPSQRMIQSIREVVIVKARPQTWYEIFQEFDKWLTLLGIGGLGGLIVAIRKIWQKRRRSATDTQPQAST